MTAWRQLRSMLYVPGNNQKMLRKVCNPELSATLIPDVLVFDLEDSVAVTDKAKTRVVLSDALPSLHEELGGRALIMPRVNPVSSGLARDDIGAMASPIIHGIHVPMVESASEVKEACKFVADAEREKGLEELSIPVVVHIETAKGVVNALDICSASPRVKAVALGGEDLTNNMGVERTKDGQELRYAREHMAMVARAVDIACLDTPWPHFKDEEGCRKECQFVRSVGFTGKFAIHPLSIPVIKSVWTPTEAELEHARRVVEAFKTVEAEGRAATSVDGVMVDYPVYFRALQVIKAGENA